MLRQAGLSHAQRGCQCPNWLVCLSLLVCSLCLRDFFLLRRGRGFRFCWLIRNVFVPNQLNRSLLSTTLVAQIVGETFKTVQQLDCGCSLIHSLYTGIKPKYVSSIMPMALFMFDRQNMEPTMTVAILRAHFPRWPPTLNKVYAVRAWDKNTHKMALRMLWASPVSLLTWLTCYTIFVILINALMEMLFPSKWTSKVQLADLPQNL